MAFRADPAKRRGDFRKVLDGINSAFDAIVQPVNDAMQVWSAMNQMCQITLQNAPASEELAATAEEVSS